nr:MAG TPA: hypothetical protein [Caudoviricetes sp.]
MRRRPCRRPVISLCNIVLHLLVRHTALLRRLSSHSAHSTNFPFSNRFLEVPYRKRTPSEKASFLLIRVRPALSIQRYNSFCNTDLRFRTNPS